jgi:hypothetical protein
MTTTTHSPLPWKALPLDSDFSKILDVNGKCVDCPTTANGALIVTSVNHHEELVAALRDVSRRLNSGLCQIDEIVKHPENDYREYGLGDVANDLRDGLKQTRALLSRIDIEKGGAE